jgi:GDP-L-fucose synthase
LQDTTGMVGSAIWRTLTARLHQPDWCFEQGTGFRQQAVKDFMATENRKSLLTLPQSGGILPTMIFRTSLLWKTCKSKIINRYRITIWCAEVCFSWSSCIYPKLAPQPLKEEYLLTDTLEPTNEWYAIAKITGESLSGNQKSIQ